MSSTVQYVENSQEFQRRDTPHPTPTPPKNELQKWLREVMTHGSGAMDTDGINPAFVTNEISITISTRVTNRRVRN